MRSLSRRDKPSMWDVNTGLTNRPRSPVSGCTRTTGWRTGAIAATRSRPTSWKRSNVRVASWTATRGSTKARRPGERVR